MEIYFQSEQVYSSTPTLGVLKKTNKSMHVYGINMHTHIYNTINILFNVYTCMCGGQILIFRVSVFLSSYML